MDTVVKIGVYFNGYIYLFGYGNTYKSAYKYDIALNTYTSIANVPYQMEMGSVCILNNIIYVFGGVDRSNSDKQTNIYKYDISTDTYTQLTDIPYNFYRGGATALDNKIYLFGGSSNMTKAQVLAFPSSEFEDKSIVLLNGSTYKTQLFTGDLVDSSVKYPFSDAWYYTEQGGLDTTIPTYYGDGTQWINFKNPPIEEVEE